jgi:hypothetical protein
MPVLLTTDQRHPVLYLRSFEDDGIASKVSFINWWNIFGGLYILTNTLHLATEEDQLKMVLNDIGPFIAMGRPSERLPKAGATRIYCRQL